MSKILVLDIETAPNVAYVWQFWQANVGAKQVLDHSYIMSFAAKWLGSDEIFYVENRKDNEAALLEPLFGLLDEADIIIAHNGNKFDLPKIKGRGLVHGMTPPSPYKTVDTCLTARRQFGFSANSLEYLCDILDCSKKLSHKKFPGFELWLECLRQNDEAWEEMKEYNIHDVISLEELYYKMLPYIENHPNVAVLKEGDVISCPKCGSEDNHRRGYYTTNVGKYQRFRCNSCGGWHRSRFTEYPKDKRHALTTHAI